MDLGKLISNWSITKRIAVSATALTLVLVLVLGAISYRNARTLIERQIDTTLGVEAERAVGRIEALLNGIVEDAKGTAGNMMVVNALVDSVGRDTYILPFLRSHRLAKAPGTSLTLYDYRGTPIASSTKVQPRSFAGAHAALDRVVNAGVPFVRLDTSREGPVLLLALPLLYPATGLAEGMLVVESALGRQLSDAVSSAVGDAAVVVQLKSGETVLWRHGPAEAGAAFQTVQPLELSAPLNRLALTVELDRAEGTAFLPLSRLTAAYAVTAVVISALTIVLFRLLAKRITGPLAILSGTARAAAETGTSSVRLPVVGPEEIASLAASFNIMLARLQEASEDLERRVQDRTCELAEANETVRRNAEFVRTILNTVDEGFIVVDREYRIITVNDAYCAQVRKTRDEVLGKHCYEVSHGLVMPCFEAGEHCAVRDTFESGQPSASLHVHPGPDGGSLHVETRAFPIVEGSGAVTSAIEVVNNVTERLHLEEQLRQAQKMEAVGVLAGGIAHDFNNILSAIIGYGSLIKMKLAPDDPNAGFLDEILSASDRAANLTRSLLTFSRKQVINPKPVDLNAIVQNTAKLLARVIREDIELIVRPSGGTLAVLVDSGQMDQVLLNLATNARDAMPHGGTLTIETSRIETDEAFLRDHGFGAAGAYALIKVSDTGLGMDEQTRRRIFEPFFTTKALGHGTGLGLAMVYGALQQNNGMVEVESAPGKGSRFLLYLPLHHHDAAAPAEPAPERVERGKETVLVAEDEQTLRQLATAILRQYGYAVIEAVDGEDALVRFQERKDDISLALLDVIMPKRNGKDVYDEIARVKPGVRVLFMSGYSADIIISKGVIGERHQVLPKPFTPAALLKRVREALDAPSRQER